MVVWRGEGAQMKKVGDALDAVHANFGLYGVFFQIYYDFLVFLQFSVGFFANFSASKLRPCLSFNSLPFYRGGVMFGETITLKTLVLH